MSSMGAMVLTLAMVGSSSSSFDFEENKTITVNQGEVFIDVEQGSMCTIGYGNQDYIFSSAHCVTMGKDILNYQGKKIGKVVHKQHDHPNPTKTNAAEDWAVIELQDNVRYGGNGYSGDNVIHISDVNIGDPVCRYGSTTREVFCTEVVEDERNYYGGGVLLSDKHMGISGDSGGPVWIPNKGLVSLHRGMGVNDTSVSVPLLNKDSEKYLYQTAKNTVLA